MPRLSADLILITLLLYNLILHFLIGDMTLPTMRRILAKSRQSVRLLKHKSDRDNKVATVALL